MCSGAPAPTAPGGLLSGSQGRGGWSGGFWQGAEPLPAGQERLLPGPGAADLQHAGAGVAAVLTLSSTTTACSRCSTPVNWAWWLPGTPGIPPVAGMLVTMMEYRQPVARS